MWLIIIKYIFSILFYFISELKNTAKCTAINSSSPIASKSSTLAETIADITEATESK